MIENKKKLEDFIAVSFIIVCILIFFSKILFFPRPLFGSDFVVYFYPIKKFIYEYLWEQGSLPFWNPYLFSGTPLIANIQASMFYPLGFLYYLVPPELAYGYSTTLHCILGSVFMYTFMRTLSVLPAGSFLSAFIFTFNGYFIGHLYAGHLSFVQSYIWIPLIFIFLYRFVLTTQFRYAVIPGLVLGIQILGGFPQIAFYTILGILAFGFFHAVFFLKGRSFKYALKLVIGLGLVICTGGALSAIQILPTLEFINLSARDGGVSYVFATYDSLHPKELLSFFIPDIFGNVVDGTYWRSHEGAHFWETCGYVGIIPFFLFFFKTRDSSLNLVRFFFIILVIVSLFLALGKFNPLYPVIYKLPGFNSFRIPAQIIFLYVFGMAVMSGIGLTRWYEEDLLLTKGFVIFLTSVGIILLFFLISLHHLHYYFFSTLFKYFAEGPIRHMNLDNLYGRISAGVDKVGLFFFTSTLFLLMRKNKRIGHRLFRSLVIAILMLDLGLFSIQFIKSYEFVIHPDKQHMINQLHRNPTQGRVLTFIPQFQPNDGLNYRFPSILGYDPLILKRYIYYIQASQDRPHDDHIVNLRLIQEPSVKFMQMLNVTHVIKGEQIALIDKSLPYATFVNKKVIRSSDEVLSFMKEKNFDPGEMVVLESEYPRQLTDRLKGEKFRTSCSVIEYGNEKIHIKTSVDQPGYLVLSEIYYPGWKAKVDGEEVPILPGNYLFRVIPLDKGEHEVFLYFISWPFRIGAILSLLTLFGALLFILTKRPVCK
ncbi:YfhO family protein [Thermodesulfobacteriota bacterium]